MTTTFQAFERIVFMFSKSGWFVVKTLLGYVSRHGFALFAWWRIVVGALGLLALMLGH